VSGRNDSGAAGVVERAGSFRTTIGASGFGFNEAASSSISRFDLCLAEVSTAA
jgi:hypothetical protein